MARKIILQRPDDSAHVLIETAVEDEAQLQGLLKANPDLLPLEEFGFTGPLMVVGEETRLPSGAIDLAGVTRGGRLVVVEFKTGPQNSDFRSALAQLLDYGSDIWRMSLDNFEATVAARYFASERCRDARVRGLRTLEDAAKATWEDLSEEDWSALHDRLTSQLASGAFEYVLAAQRFTEPTLKTMEYLNATSNGPRFYAIEMVRFDGDGVSAFESRTVLKPPQGPGSTSAPADKSSFLDSIGDPEYRATLEELFDASQGLGLRIEWGARGCSIRLPTTYRAEPVSIAWLFPPGRTGWMRLTGFNLGFDPGTAESVPSARPALDAYVEAVAGLSGAEPVGRAALKAYSLIPPRVIDQQSKIVELLANLVSAVSA